MLVLLASATPLGLAVQHDMRLVSPVALAYLGDAVYELHVRQALLHPPRKHNDYCLEVRDLACAHGQHSALERLVAGSETFALSEVELDWIRRGRNASGRGPRTASPQVYRAASSLETLLGYLHLADSARCAEVMDFLLSSRHGAGNVESEGVSQPDDDR